MTEVDEAAFHHKLLADHGTYVGPGHWFEVLMSSVVKSRPPRGVFLAFTAS